MTAPITNLSNYTRHARENFGHTIYLKHLVGHKDAKTPGTLWERLADDPMWRKAGHPHNGHNASAAASFLTVNGEGARAAQDGIYDSAAQRPGQPMNPRASGIIRAGVRVR